MADAVVLVHARAAERHRVDLLAERVPDDAGPGEEHRGVLGHDDQVGQRRRIGPAAGRCAGHDRDLRDHAGQPDRVAEDPAIPGERGLALLHPGPARLDERDDRNLRPLGGLQDANDRVRVLLPQRSAEVGAVLRVAGDRSSGDAAGGAQDPVAGHSAGSEPTRDHAGAQRPDAAGIAKGLEPLERIEPPDPLTLDGRAHDSAPLNTSVTLWPPNANEFEIATGGWPLDSNSGRASPGT